MSRDIKFRAWKVDEKRMVSLDPSESDDWCSTDLIEDGNWKVMQFTGLHDKNGKEIFEGDVVRIYGKSTHAVEWFRGCLGFWREDRGEFWNWVGASFVEPVATEVIGNIHENPGLLQVAT